MRATARTEQTKSGNSAKMSEKGGGYADARVATGKATGKKGRKSPEKTRGGGYADAKAVGAEAKGKTSKKSSEKMRGGYLDAKAAAAKPTRRQSK